MLFYKCPKVDALTVMPDTACQRFGGWLAVIRFAYVWRHHDPDRGGIYHDKPDDDPVEAAVDMTTGIRGGGGALRSRFPCGWSSNPAAPVRSVPRTAHAYTSLPRCLPTSLPASATQRHLGHMSLIIGTPFETRIAKQNIITRGGNSDAGLMAGAREKIPAGLSAGVQS